MINHNFAVILSVLCITISNAKLLPQVVFKCYKPSLYMTPEGWSYDFQQNCIGDLEESRIVEYCQRKYPNLKIVNAEPSPQKVIITNWCDFEEKNCESEVKVTTFVCLDSKFQSDSLTLPKKCKFKHITYKGECKDYKELKAIANDACSSVDQKMYSVGMTFPCEKAKMHYYGVEFVCCPKDDVTQIRPINFGGRIKSPMVESVESEQIKFQKQEKLLLESERIRLKTIIDEFKKGRKQFEELAKSDPGLADRKRKKLEKVFTEMYLSLTKQFQENKGQLMLYYNDRLDFIFHTRIDVLKTQLSNTIASNDQSSTINTLRTVLDVIHTRRIDLRKEIEYARKSELSIVKELSRNLKQINDSLNGLLKIFDTKPLLKNIAEAYVRGYIPKIEKHHLRSYHSVKREFNDIRGILHKSHGVDNTHNHHESSRIYYDLGVEDPDQYDSYGKKIGLSHDLHVNHNGEIHRRRHHYHEDSKTMHESLFSLLMVAVSVGMIIIAIATALLIYRQTRRRRARHGTIVHPAASLYSSSPSLSLKSSTIKSGQYYQRANSTGSSNYPGFGVNNGACRSSLMKGDYAKDSFNVLENPTYKLQFDQVSELKKKEAEKSSDISTENTCTNTSEVLIE